MAIPAITFNGWASGASSPSFVNVMAPPYSAKGDGVTDDTAAIQSAINACGAAGGGKVIFPTGTYIVSATTTAGSGANSVIGALLVPSNVTLEGAGCGTTIIKLAAATLTNATTSYAVITNKNPDTGNVYFGCADLSIDCNRANLGPYVNNLSLASGAGQVQVIGLNVWGVTDGFFDNIEVLNCPFAGFFVNGSSKRIISGDLFFYNCEASACYNSVSQSSMRSVTVVNSDPAPTLTTTSSTAVTAGTTVAVTAAASTHVFNVNDVLLVDAGTANYEYVLVTTGGTGTFTGYFARAHSGTWNIVNAPWQSDAAVQIHVGASQVTLSAANVDYSGARGIVGAGAEIVGCKSVSIGSLQFIGTAGGAWIHNIQLGGSNYILDSVSISSIEVTNAVAGLNGSAPTAIHLDDAGLTGSTNTLRDVAISSAVVRYGYNGVTAPSGATGVAVEANTAGITIGSLSHDGGSIGIQLNGASASSWGALSIRNTTQQGVLLFNNAQNNTFASVVVQNPGQQGIALYGTSNQQGNVFAGVSVKGVPASYFAIDLNVGGTTGSVTHNTFIGDVSGNTKTYSQFNGSGGVNPTRLIGYNPVGNIGGGAPTLASGTPLYNYTGSDMRVVIAGGTVAQIALNGTNTNLTSGVFFVAQGEYITISYSVAPTTYVWFGV